MSKLDYKNIIYEKFIKPFKKHNKLLIGLELEFPIINKDKKEVDGSIIKELIKTLIKELNFKVLVKDLSGVPIRISNRIGDAITFEYSFNTIEFILKETDNILEFEKRFREYFLFVQKFLSSRGHLLTGLGLNPNFKNFLPTPLNTSRGKTLKSFSCSKGKDIKDYIPNCFAFTCGNQIHLSFPEEELIDNLNFLSSLSWIAAKLFSNSTDLTKSLLFHKNLICVRDLFQIIAWGESTKTRDEKYKNINDIIEDIALRYISLIKRKGMFYLINPVKVKDFFKASKVKAKDFTSEESIKEIFIYPQKTDINTFRPYRRIDISKFGTIEMRSDCQQKASEVFAPVAFYTGALLSKDKIIPLLSKYKSISNSQKRKDVIILEQEKWINDKEFLNLIKTVLELISSALKKRGKGEEFFLKPLFKRAKTLKSPSEECLSLLKKGKSIEDIVTINSKL